MSTSEKPDPARGWQFVEKLLADHDLERFDQASDEEVERQMNALGIDTKGMPTAEELIARVEARAKKRQLAQAPPATATVRSLPRTRLIAWLAAAAIGAVVASLVVERQKVIALFHREAPPEPQKPREELVRAEALRRDALAACGVGHWDECEKKLDEAKALDAKGETDPRVMAARRSIEWSKPPPSPLPKSFPDTK